jgi:hypothetical protein
VALRKLSYGSGLESEFREKIVYKVLVQAPWRVDRASDHHLHLHTAAQAIARYFPFLWSLSTTPVYRWAKRGSLHDLPSSYSTEPTVAHGLNLYP